MNRLTQKDVNEIAGALDRLKELNTKTIKESTDAAEQRGTQAFVQTKAVEHLEELLACWITVQTQYRPLLEGFSGLLGNAMMLLQKREQRAEPTPDMGGCAPQPEPSSEKPAN